MAGGYGNHPAASMPQVQLQHQVQVGSGAMLPQPANIQPQPIIIVIQQQQPQQQQPPPAMMFPGQPWSGGVSVTAGPPAVPGSVAPMTAPLVASGPSGPPAWGGSGMMPQLQQHTYVAMSAGQQQQQSMQGWGQQLQQPMQNGSHYQQQQQMMHGQYQAQYQQQPWQAQGQQQQFQHQFWRG